MSDKNTGVAPPVPPARSIDPPAEPPPDVHVDTPAQAAARQMIDSSPRTTHVHIEPEPVEPPPPDAKEDLSLAALEPKAKAKDTFTVTKTSETTAHVTKGKS